MAPALPGFHIEGLDLIGEEYIIVARASSPTAVCPVCRQETTAVHSQYERKPSDLPSSGLAVRLCLQVRRFFCQNEAGERKIFCERLPQLAPVYARRTLRLTETLVYLAFALGGEVGACVVERLGMSVSRDTLLRLMRKQAIATDDAPCIIGIDDWAFRKGKEYGTIICDLKTGQVIDLLPDREVDSLANWLKQQPTVTVITRDRSRVYAEGAAIGAPQAVQVADRFHLFQNLTEATAKVMKQYSQAIKTALHPSSATQAAQNGQEDPLTAMTPADKRRQDRILEAQRLHQLGWHKQDIAYHLSISRQTVLDYLRMSPENATLRRKPRNSLIASYKPYLRQRWREGCRVTRQLYREIKAQGYRGTESNVRKYVGPWRKSGLPMLTEKERIPTANTLAYFITQPDDQQHQKVTVLLQKVARAHENVALCIHLARQFATMVRQRLPEQLTHWLQAAHESGLKPFSRLAKSLQADAAAVRAALQFEYANGPVEGHVNRLKMIKRMMFGRANFDLLRQRVLYRF